jgi:DNA-binding MarR family transcriptional regulator
MGRGRRVLWMALAAELEQRGESIFVWQTVCYLARNGPLSQRDLAYANAQHPAGMSRLLHELETAGLVRRKTDVSDRRRLLVEVTPRGRTWFDSVTPGVMSGVDSAMKGLSARERTALRGLLIRLLGEDETPAPESSARPRRTPKKSGRSRLSQRV